MSKKIFSSVPLSSNFGKEKRIVLILPPFSSKNIMSGKSLSPDELLPSTAKENSQHITNHALFLQNLWKILCFFFSSTFKFCGYSQIREHLLRSDWFATDNGKLCSIKIFTKSTSAFTTFRLSLEEPENMSEIFLLEEKAASFTQGLINLDDTDGKDYYWYVVSSSAVKWDAILL